MCGIVGYIGDRYTKEVLIQGLERLDSRGYDSAGVGVRNGDDIAVIKRAGKVEKLKKALKDKPLTGSMGIAHTRWSTHGAADSDVNAHPHSSQNGDFTLVHNGTIENHSDIRNELEKKGYTFKSQTDTEVLAQLIESIYNAQEISSYAAIRHALKRVRGAYAIVCIAKDAPNMLFAARKGAPLLIGIGANEYFLASAAPAFIEYTSKKIHLDDEEIVMVTQDSVNVRTFEDIPVEKEVEEAEWSIEEIEKAGYEHYMLKEVMEQPKTLEGVMQGRVRLDENSIQLGGLQEVHDILTDADRVIFTGCGTSYYAGLLGTYVIESLARTAVSVEYASEFRYRDIIFRPGDVVIAISQSGGTADTLAAVQKAKESDIPVLGIVNVVGSQIARETDAGVYLHAGPEIGVASTKAFTAQVTVLIMIALSLGMKRGEIEEEDMRRYLQELAKIPDKMREVLQLSDQLREIATIYNGASSALYMGRGYDYPVALEGALKLKEISYIHSEGLPAAEMKHGLIALIDEFIPTIVIATRDRTFEKTLSNIQEVSSRKGKVIAVTDSDNDELNDLCEHVIHVPKTAPFLAPLLTVVALQLLSYHIAVQRGCDVDQPRNLAKSVTVE